MPAVSRYGYRPHMEAPRLDAIAAAYPAAQVCRVEGVLHAWVPDGPGSCSGAEAHAEDEAGLLAKLARG